MDEKEILKRTHNLIIETNRQVSALKGVVVVWFVLWLITIVVCAIVAGNAAAESEAAQKSLQRQIERATSSYGY